MDIAIRCESLSKQYRIGQPDSYKTLRDVIASTAATPFRRLRRVFNASNGASANGDSIGNRQSSIGNLIWALKDVSFEVRPGEVVGIIGRNGAGKSTLLKILSRITKPTQGYAEINGRVGSLLEVGTGFHPELSGRENIYLNGAILGMRKTEIEQKFDEIVAFAEVKQFIDTPVKRYSSGMYVRLAFAVAAHMESEILLVDEVLAVGDAQFQKRCFSKIREAGREGKTIVMVSHNMAAVRNICSRGVLLRQGHVTRCGEINEIVDAYVSESLDGSSETTIEETESFLVDQVLIIPTASTVIKTFQPVEIRVQFRPKIDIADPGLYVSVLTSEFHRLVGLDFKDFASIPMIRAGDTAEIGFRIDSFPLLSGVYHLEIHLKDLSQHLVEFLPRHYSFEVAETTVYGGRRLDRWFGSVGVKATALVNGSPLG
ncbi:MAG TPA: ABC transporter ATP-binding protein [Pyrinomonadaceae bacterium]